MAVYLEAAAVLVWTGEFHGAGAVPSDHGGRGGMVHAAQPNDRRLFSGRTGDSMVGGGLFHLCDHAQFLDVCCVAGADLFYGLGLIPEHADDPGSGPTGDLWSHALLPANQCYDGL